MGRDSISLLPISGEATDRITLRELARLSAEDDRTGYRLPYMYCPYIDADGIQKLSLMAFLILSAAAAHSLSA